MHIDFILSKPLTATDHAALEEHLGRMVELDCGGRAVSVVSIDLTLTSAAKAFLKQRGYHIQELLEFKTL
jgi:hypothetical protein